MEHTTKGQGKMEHPIVKRDIQNKINDIRYHISEFDKELQNQINDLRFYIQESSYIPEQKNYILNKIEDFQTVNNLSLLHSLEEIQSSLYVEFNPKRAKKRGFTESIADSLRNFVDTI